MADGFLRWTPKRKFDDLDAPPFNADQASAAGYTDSAHGADDAIASIPQERSRPRVATRLLQQAVARTDACQTSLVRELNGARVSISRASSRRT